MNPNLIKSSLFRPRNAPHPNGPRKPLNNKLMKKVNIEHDIYPNEAPSADHSPCQTFLGRRANGVLRQSNRR